MSHFDFGRGLKHGVIPLCAWCGRALDPSAMDIRWFWFVVDKTIHYGHTECAQANMEEEEVEDFVEWLKEVQEDMDDFSASTD